MGYVLPAPEDIAIGPLLERNARAKPAEPLIAFDDGTRWTRRDALEIAYGAAATLRAAGISQGDRVALLMNNSPDYLRSWWGTAVMGAVVVPVNVAYRGSMLEHQLRLSRPAAIIADSALADRLDQLDDVSHVPPVRLVPADLDRSGPPIVREQRIELWDLAALMLTSGTTGPSKLVAVPHLHLYLGGSHFSVAYGAGESDVYQIDLPLFHIGMMYQVAPCLSVGTRMFIRSGPRMSAYWESARECDATIGMIISTMVPYLLAQPPRPADRAHGVRMLLASPLPRDVAEFQQRFNIPHLHAAYGSTEMSAPIVGSPGDRLESGYCGRARPGFEVRLVDEHEIEVPVGEVGEVAVRPAQPWMVNAGYVDDPAATAHAWRQGWLHSGDAMRRDADGRYYFVDRIKDTVRRRGENISSFEVEAIISVYPGIAAAACVAYRDPLGVDDEVKVWLTTEPGSNVDPVQLLEFCADRLPHFMVPRYFEATDAMPMTPSGRVRKHLLRERGNGPRTWDREAHGLTVVRGGLERRLGS
jgi:crotonobetaine/carnitine-CoA ligase